jgi:hypothetical protein
MQLFLLGFIIVEICEIFTVGGFPLPPADRSVFLVRSPYHTHGQDNGDEGQQNRAYQKFFSPIKPRLMPSARAI